jgi:hypothetical protein
VAVRLANTGRTKREQKQLDDDIITDFFGDEDEREIENEQEKEIRKARRKENARRK